MFAKQLIFICTGLLSLGVETLYVERWRQIFSRGYLQIGFSLSWSIANFHDQLCLCLKMIFHKLLMLRNNIEQEFGSLFWYHLDPYCKYFIYCNISKKLPDRTLEHRPRPEVKGGRKSIEFEIITIVYLLNFLVIYYYACKVMLMFSY